MSTITLEQFEQILKTNVLTDPKMWVRNASFPRGQISFRVLGSDFRMRDVIIPITGSAVDLTEYAPLQNLLASAELRQVFASKQLRLVNPQDMPEPNDQKFPAYTLVDVPVTEGDTAISGSAPEGTQVQSVINGKVSATITGEDKNFSLPVLDALVAGQQFNVSFMKEKYETKNVAVTVQEKPKQVYPQPTVADFTNFDSQITGTTLEGATVILLNDGKSVDVATAGSDGKFALDVPYPHGTLEILFSHEGYTDLTVTPAAKQREVNVTMITPKYLDDAVLLNINPAQPQPFGVEIEIAGQALINVTVPANETEYNAKCNPIQGDVKATVKSTGYKETTFSRTPEKNDFGTVTVDAVHAEEKVVKGTVVLKAGSTDVKAELVTDAKTYDVAVGSDGAFSFATDALDAGDAIITFSSEFYNSKATEVDILGKDLPAPTLNDAYEGDTVITGTTLEGVKVSVGDKSVVAPAGGAFSLTVDALSAGNKNVLFQKTNYADKTVVLAVKALSVQITPTHKTVYVGETEINGTAEPDAEIFIEGNKVGTVESDGNFELSGPAMNSAETLTFKKLHYADKTLTVTPTALSNFTQPALTITEGDTTITSTTESHALVTCAAASASVEADDAGSFTLNLKSAAVAAQEIEIGFAKRGFANSSFTYTVAAKAAE